MKQQQQQQLQECSRVWICDTLTNLNHPNPQSVCDCLCIGTSRNERMIADKQFQMILQWIEDTILRQWEPRKRKQFLRNTTNFWTHGILDYIQDLDCPPHYYYTNNTVEEGWKYNFHLRKRILHWIITCAISDSYEEQQHKQPTTTTTHHTTTTQQQQQQIHTMRLTYLQKMKQIQLQLNQQICHNIQLQSNNIQK